MLNAPAIPATSISPTRDKIALLEPLRYPPISELAQPMLRLAGLAHQSEHERPAPPALFRQHEAQKYRRRQRNAGRSARRSTRSSRRQWSPDGKYIAAGNITPTGVELWIVDTATAKATKVKNVLRQHGVRRLSLEDSTNDLGDARPDETRPGTGISESDADRAEHSGNDRPHAARSQTFQDLLKSPERRKAVRVLRDVAARV